jgi:hypothetical protein
MDFAYALLKLCVSLYILPRSFLILIAWPTHYTKLQATTLKVQRQDALRDRFIPPTPNDALDGTTVPLHHLHIFVHKPNTLNHGSIVVAVGGKVEAQTQDSK